MVLFIYSEVVPLYLLISSPEFEDSGNRTVINYSNTFCSFPEGLVFPRRNNEKCILVEIDCRGCLYKLHTYSLSRLEVVITISNKGSRCTEKRQGEERILMK